MFTLEELFGGLPTWRDVGAEKSDLRIGGMRFRDRQAAKNWNDVQQTDKLVGS